MANPYDKGDRLYRYVPKSIIPVIFVSLLILGTLFFEISSDYPATNPIVFYGLPFLYLIVFMTIETPKTIMKASGWLMPTKRSKIFGLIGIPVGGFIGWGIAQFATLQQSILPLATYPWVASSYGTAGTLSVLSLTPQVGLVLYAVVSFFEENSAVLLGKNAANWIYDTFNTSSPALVSAAGLYLGRVVLTAHHWFSYQGFDQPGLYISAFVIFSIFTTFGILFGMLAKGYITGDEMSTRKVVPVLTPVMMIAHWAFDYTISIVLGVA